MLITGCARSVADDDEGATATTTTPLTDIQPRRNPPIATTESAPLIPRDVLFGNPQRAQARLSPDGKWLSFLAPVDGVLNVWVGPVDDISKAEAGHRGKGPPHPQPRLGLRQQAHPLRARQERRREFSPLRHRTSRPARRKTSRRSTASAPRSRRSARSSRTKSSSASTTATRSCTTSGGSTSRRARKSSCSRTPASPAI